MPKMPLVGSVLHMLNKFALYYYVNIRSEFSIYAQQVIDFIKWEQEHCLLLYSSYY